MKRYVIPFSLLTLLVLGQDSCSEEDADGDGWTTEDGDCNDSNPDVHPGAEEVCDGVDNDCDGYIDDADGDGFKSAECGGWDCDDGDASVHPEATETCDGVDDDCDGTIDNAGEQTWFRDADGDGYGDSDNAEVLVGCDLDGWSLDGGDCDDGDDAVHPGAEEVCDGVDNDCNGEVDELSDGFGGSADCAALSCKDILDLDPDAESGLYWIDPRGDGDAWQTYCDMDTDSGGWTLLGKTVNSNLSSDERDAIHYGTWLDYSELGYGSPEPDAKIFWAPLVEWNELTSVFSTNVLAIDVDANTHDIRMTDVSIASQDGGHEIYWTGAVSGYAQIVTGVKGAEFTTYDNDNDTWTYNCAKDNIGYNGGWWYTDCYQLSMLHSNNNLYAWDENVEVAVDYLYIWFRED